jgi:putative hydrolase of the HAD superfamily
LPSRLTLTRPSSTSRAAFSATSFSIHAAQSQLLPDGALGILKELAASDKCMLGALNNEARETNEYRFELRPAQVLQGGAEFLLSGIAQAGPAIYKRALDILGRPAERVLFIDDRPENVAGQRRG